MARKAPVTSGPPSVSGGSAFTPAPDTAPAKVATGSAPGTGQSAGVQDVDQDHPVVHRSHSSAAPYTP